MARPGRVPAADEQRSADGRALESYGRAGGLPLRPPRSHSSPEDAAMTTSLIGYGRFHLENFRRGEQFARHDGSIGRVCEDQPFLEPQPNCNQPFLPDHLWVWINEGTCNATRTFLHR